MLRGRANGKPRLGRWPVKGMHKQEAAKGDKRNRKFYLGSRQSVQVPPLTPTCLPDPSSRGNQAFPPADGPRLLLATFIPSPACHGFLLRCLRAVGRNRPVWRGAGYPAPVHCLPHSSSAPLWGAGPHGGPTAHPHILGEDRSLPTAG